MQQFLATCRRLIPQSARFLLITLALVSQLAVGAMVLPDAPPQGKAEELKALGTLCTGKPANHHQPASRHHAPDPAVCPLSIALALPTVLPATFVVFPPPASTAIPQRRSRPEPRGPPRGSVFTGTPRGPPVLA